jgi:hypothetical protein
VIAWIGIAFGLGGLIGWFGGAAYGYLAGVKETERRWSDAVGRADDARRQAADPEAGI